MEEIINGLKQIKTRVDSGTITTVNGTETLLSKQLSKMIEEAINYTRCSTELPDEDAKLLYRLLPEWAKKTEKGLNPFFYGTNSYKGDKAIVNKVKAILKKAIT
jgi:hypothetical protein